MIYAILLGFALLVIFADTMGFITFQNPTILPSLFANKHHSRNFKKPLRVCIVFQNFSAENGLARFGYIIGINGNVVTEVRNADGLCCHVFGMCDSWLLEKKHLQHINPWNFITTPSQKNLASPWKIIMFF